MSLVVAEPAGTITVTPPALAGLVIQAAEAREVQQRVADALATMCAVRIGSVDVSVEEVE